MSNKADLIIDSSETNSDLFYSTNFFVPDPVIFIKHDGITTLVLNDLEIDRGREESSADEIISLKECISCIPGNNPLLTDIAEYVLKKKKIKTISVQKSFPVLYADSLREKGFKIKVCKNNLFYESRNRKNSMEVSMIRNALAKTAQAMNIAISMISSSNVRGKKLYLKGKVLTSEMVKSEINSYLAARGFNASHTIVAGGVQGSMPHHSGKGHIRAGWPVVIDIFPRSQETGYFGDMTRTVVKGRPTKRVLEMYKTVLEGQKLGISLIKHGVKTSEVHKSIVKLFEESGFKTENINGKPQGFIHSTGHGLGLDIHEPPRIADNDIKLEEGNVVTVEPGLYYEELGGIRIEDVVLVTKKGNINLTRCKKQFIV